MSTKIIIEDLGPEYDYKRPDQCAGDVPIEAFTMNDIDLRHAPTN